MGTRSTSLTRGRQSPARRPSSLSSSAFAAVLVLAHDPVLVTVAGTVLALVFVRVVFVVAVRVVIVVLAVAGAAVVV